ncbi:uncharacterized protein [Leptinotarsa decemlineata]|uniref:uncharacterized protein n=1 Tax=Leptinotarsa decemlineata TaxID=7539 RepID=UPI000C254C12|nr:13 kDa deflagellation-inducible protein-like [Leptinotarsa decemlineata]
MSEHGAALQTYNQELVKCLEDIKRKKNEIVHCLHREEAEKLVLEKNVKVLQDKLKILNRNIDHHKSIYEQYDKIINETENGFRKILESSQTLLQVVQQQTTRIDSRHNSISGVNKLELKDTMNSNPVFDN